MTQLRSQSNWSHPRLMYYCFCKMPLYHGWWILAVCKKTMLWAICFGLVVKMLMYLPLCHCCSIHFWKLDGGLAHHLSIGEDALSDVLVSACYHCEAGHPHSVTAHRVWVESTKPCEDGLHHSVAVRPLCRTMSPNETPANDSRYIYLILHIINVRLLSMCDPYFLLSGPKSSLF